MLNTVMSKVNDIKGEQIIKSTKILHYSKRFKTMIGWGTPSVGLKPNRYLVFIHSDRLLTIFPCAAVRIDDNIIITYGAGGYVIEVG